MIVPVEFGRAPELLTVAESICVADPPARRPVLLASLGEHTDEVLGAAGYDADAIARLRVWQDRGSGDDDARRRCCSGQRAIAHICDEGRIFGVFCDRQ